METDTCTETFEAALDDLATVFTRAGLLNMIVEPESVTAHVAVVGEDSKGVYRCVPADTGLHVWWVPADGPPVRLACAPSSARAAGAILDHREGVPT